MRRLLRQRLLHFLVLGAALFALFEWTRPAPPESADPTRIVVDRDALLRFMQYRSRTFDAERVAQRLDGLDAAARDALLRDLVREEVLYREAVALGLGRDDYVIRRRLVQKLEFLTEGVEDARVQPTRAELETYFDAHRADYAVPPLVTFTHVFFDASKRGAMDAERAAAAALRELNTARVPFARAASHGDRFAYHRNYVERDRDTVMSHLGKPLADAVFALPPGDAWHGPYRSAHGSHVLQVAARSDPRQPPLEEVIDRVERDLRYERVRQATEQAIQALIARYRVEARLGPPPAVGAGAGADEPRAQGE